MSSRIALHVSRSIFRLVVMLLTSHYTGFCNRFASSERMDRRRWTGFPLPPPPNPFIITLGKGSSSSNFMGESEIPRASFSPCPLPIIGPWHERERNSKAVREMVLVAWWKHANTCLPSWKHLRVPPSQLNWKLIQKQLQSISLTKICF